MDHYKQLGIIEDLNKMDSLLNSKSIVVFKDNIIDYNWLNRMISPIEYTGYLHRANNKNDRFGIRFSTYEADPKITLSNFLQYKDYYFLSDFVANDEIIYVDIDSEAKIKSPTFASWLKLKYYETFFNRHTFYNELENILKIKINISQNKT
jgi:hypothetical protein